MCFFKKKEKLVVMDNKAAIRENVAKLAPIVTKLAECDAELAAKISAFKDEVEYSTPSNERSVVELDKKLQNKIDDLKLEVTKACERTNDFEPVRKALSAAEVLLSERNARAEAVRS